MTGSAYQKLPGPGLTWTGFSRVWLGADHVLLVHGRTFVESYRRFFFHDIQAVIVRRTHVGKIWNAVWGAGAAFFGLIALMVDSPASLVLAGVATPFALALVFNLALGPTCACHIRTAVQTERVPALNRVRAARKFIARIDPLIAAAQNGAAPEQFEGELAALQNAPFTSSVDFPPVVDA